MVGLLSGVVVASRDATEQRIQLGWRPRTYGGVFRSGEKIM